MMKNKLIGIYLDEEVLENIEGIASSDGTDKTSVIKRAITEFIDNHEKNRKEKIIEEYISLKINEIEIKKSFSWKEVPRDIREARKEFLKNIKRKNTGK